MEMGIDILGRFYAIFDKKTNFVTSFLLSCTPIHFWKGVYSKRKEFDPKGSNSFLLEWPIFRSEAKIILAELPPLIVYLFPLNSAAFWTYTSM